MNLSIGNIRGVVLRHFLPALFLVSLATMGATVCRAEESLDLNELVAEGLRNSPEILAAEARAEAAGYRIPQAKSLPDPMFMFGYQNEGFQTLTIGRPQNANAMGMSSLSQMFYYPGKRKLKGEMATRDAESITAMYDQARLEVASKIKQLYYDLFLAYKTIDILNDRTSLYARIEDAASSRYASGMGTQQEVVMAQTEKYMLLEKEEMQKQKIQAIQGMLNATVGRNVNDPLGRPSVLDPTPFNATLESILWRLPRIIRPKYGPRKKWWRGPRRRCGWRKRSTIRTLLSAQATSPGPWVCRICGTSRQRSTCPFIIRRNKDRPSQRRPPGSRRQSANCRRLNLWSRRA